MLAISEDVCRAVIDMADAHSAVEKVFAAMANGDAYNFPVVREDIGYANALYGFKSGFDRAGLVLGLKSGGYWPNNESKGLTNHQSTVLLFDPDTGLPQAIVGGNYLTAMRTAAAAAVSIARLARKDAKVLGIVGAGHQSAFQLRAAAGQRNFQKVIAWNRNQGRLQRLATAAEQLGLPFEAVNLDRLGAEADVIVSITSSHNPILKRSHIRPGTHLACMGTDTKGKQEVEVELVASATLFTDEVAQSATIGECQHAIARRLIEDADITPIGAVINGEHRGRSSRDEITLFDGTGVGLQDLAVAHAAVSNARKRQLAAEIEF